MTKLTFDIFLDKKNYPSEYNDNCLVHNGFWVLPESEIDDYIFLRIFNQSEKLKTELFKQVDIMIEELVDSSITNEYDLEGQIYIDLDDTDIEFLMYEVMSGHDKFEFITLID